MSWYPPLDVGARLFFPGVKDAAAPQIQMILELWSLYAKEKKGSQPPVMSSHLVNLEKKELMLSPDLRYSSPPLAYEQGHLSFYTQTSSIVTIVNPRRTTSFYTYLQSPNV